MSDKPKGRRYDKLPSIHEVDGWVSSKRAAELLGLEGNTIRYLILHGDLRATRWAGHALMVSKESVEVYQQSRRTPGRPPMPPASTSPSQEE
jgi:hypothetical protein